MLGQTGERRHAEVEPFVALSLHLLEQHHDQIIHDALWCIRHMPHQIERRGRRSGLPQNIRERDDAILVSNDGDVVPTEIIFVPEAERKPLFATPMHLQPRVGHALQGRKIFRDILGFDDFERHVAALDA